MPKNANKTLKHGYDIQRMGVIVLCYVGNIASFFKRDTDRLEFHQWEGVGAAQGGVWIAVNLRTIRTMDILNLKEK